MLEARGLRKAVMPTCLLDSPSPASIHSNRLALHVDEGGESCSIYLASGSRLYNVEISINDSLVTKGKDNLLIPVEVPITQASLVDRCPHRSEIQSVVLADGDVETCPVLGTVDSYGHVIVSQISSSDAGSELDGLSYSILPRDCGVGEGAWAGMCFSSTQWSTVAVGQYFSKTVDVYDQDIHLRSLRTLWYPASFIFVQNQLLGNGTSSILAVTEGSQLSIWDMRIKEGGGCVQRVCGAIGDVIYAVCDSPTGAIAIGGSDRTVTIYDPRRWSALSRWVNCSKYEITGLDFSSIDSKHIYIQGIDYEVLCGQWKEKNKVFAFRGDSNWLGFSKCSKSDVLGGWCESGSIFVADVIKESEDFSTD